MENVTLDKLIEFEKNIKKEIIIKYNNVLPKDKVDFLVENNYFNKNNYNENKSVKKYNGELLRHIFSILINVSYSTENKINEKEIKTTIHGTDLETGLIEYYTNIIAEEYNIEINKRPDLKTKLKQAQDLANKLGNQLDKVVFEDNNENINNIINSPKNIPSLSLIYDNKEQFIKYIDENNEIHLIKSENPEEVSKLYKQLSEKNINSKEMFEKLTDIQNKKETKAEETNILDFVKPSIEDKTNLDDTLIDDVISDIYDEEKKSNDVIDDTIENKDDEINETHEMNSNEYERKILKDDSNYNEIVKNTDNAQSSNLEKNKEIIIIDNNDTMVENNNEPIKINDTDNRENDIFKNNEDNQKIENDVENLKEDFENKIKLNETPNVAENDINIDNKEEKKKKRSERNEDMYMIFYIFAITISIALIIGIIILKFYS